ncbi:MAG: InlB B-repeat-containing protein, partial [Clostridia bacterium]|nr:InlB B-repeat-containing protein [Clostridia bacterium]
MRKKVKLASAIIIGVLFFCAVLGTTFHLLIGHINKNDPNATTESATLTTNIFNTNGTINSSAANELLTAVGYWNNPSNTAKYTAHNIAGRTSDNSGSTIIFPMGYVNRTSGDPLYWQATYLSGGYLSIWLSKCYTTSTWNASSVTVSYDTYATSTIQEYIDDTFYPLVTQSSSTLKSIFATPSVAGYQTLKSGTSNDTTYYFNSNYTSKFDNMSTTIGNGSYMWLPSFGEVFNNTTSSYTSNTTTYTGQWGLNSTDRAFATSLYTSSTINYCWLRSGYSNYGNAAMRVLSTGSAINSYVNYSYGVRPAAHISLSTLASYVATTVTLDQQGGNGGTTTIDAFLGNAMPSITIPTRTGYTFGGYYTSTNGGGTQYYTATGASATNYPSSGGPTTLYAKWTGNTYYVKYNANGDSGTMSNSTHTYGTASALTTNAFNRTGYSFSGWATSSTGAVAYSNGASVSTLTTTSGGTYNLYAVWTPNPYVITLQTNNSDLGSVTGGGTFNYGSEQTFIAITASGCGFMYWIDGSGNTYTANPLTITISGDATFTAIFTNGVMDGIACMAEAGGEVRMNGYNDSDTTIHFSAVAYAGYTFDGWYIYGESTALS